MTTGFIPTSNGPHIPVEVPAGSTLANTSDVNSKNATQDAAIAAALPWRGILPNGTDISKVRTPGIYTVPTTTAAGTMVNWPTIRSGILKVWTNDGGSATIQEVTAYVSTALPTENYARGTISSGNTSWSPWGTTEWNKGLANGTETNRTNVDDFTTAGAWAVSSRTYVDGLPGSSTGTLEVLAWPGTGLSMQRFTERVSASTFATWQRMSLSTVSRYTGVSWEKVGGVSGGGGATVQILADGSDLQKIRSGAHLITTATSAATMLDMPVNAPGLLESWSATGTARALQRLTLDTLDGIAVYERVTGLALSFPEWQKRPTGGGGGGKVSADPVSDHASRVEYARSRRGGGTGVLGKAVVMIRFDHWLVKFRDVILPIMREYGLVGTLNVNYDNMNNVQNGSGSITWGHVQDWNQYDGIEIANHGSTHTNASTRESIFHEVVDGRRNLETAMPRVAVETWQEHGSAYLTASDIPGDIGLNLGREPKNFFESYAGKLILAEHAIIEGKCGGFFTNLTGHPQIGQSHMSIDQSTAAQAIGQVDTAKQFQRGVTLYVHPGLMDTVLVGGKAWDVTYNPNGSIVVTDPATSSTTPFADEAAYQSWATTNGHTIYMRTSYFRELCAYLAAERDAGKLLVMTAAGGGFADKNHARRENLLVNPGFETTPASWWTGTSSWTITSPGDSVVLKAPASAGTLTQGMLMHSRFGWAMGATHELVVKVRSSSAASLTLRMEKLGDAATWQVEKVHAIPGDNTVREYRLNLTLPRDPSITQMSIKISGDNGLEIVGKPLLAAI